MKETSFIVGSVTGYCASAMFQNVIDRLRNETPSMSTFLQEKDCQVQEKNLLEKGNNLNR